MYLETRIRTLEEHDVAVRHAVRSMLALHASGKDATETRHWVDLRAAIPDPDAASEPTASAPAKRWWVAGKDVSPTQALSEVEAQLMVNSWTGAVPDFAPYLAIEAESAEAAVAEYRRRVAVPGGPTVADIERLHRIGRQRTSDDTSYRASVEGDLRGEIDRLTSERDAALDSASNLRIKVATLMRERDDEAKKSAEWGDIYRSVRTRAERAQAEVERLTTAGKDLANALGAAMSYSQFDGLPQAERTRCLEALVAWANATGLGVVGREAQDVLRGGV